VPEQLPVQPAFRSGQPEPIPGQGAGPEARPLLKQFHPAPALSPQNADM